ncbi:extensin family protein [Tessaracoccus lacteus]|uniref:Extensin family protein n=1 Tax=Tessaracoccus lacteus TaxID=3041766 RepID=A0ABY8PXH4_9ACTN|nr:extensin family protein [Tessaracoccus sp. T21]WGT47200.1 extensin family protein [Tessaracoccus sp. T21]
MVRRRALLAAAVTLPLTGCVDVGSFDGSTLGGCRTPDSLVSFDTVGGAPLAYELSGNRQAFRADPRFIELLDAWAADWESAAGLGQLTEISTYGAYVDRCESWHAAGRAFDFAVVRHEDGEVSCRYDEWGDDAGRLRDYWRLAASLAAHLTYTLTLSYNAQHHNHIHVDNGVSGYDAPRFREQSRAQVQVIQGVVRHVFGRDCPENGSYDDATRDAVRSVQSQLGITAPLADVDGWRQFLTRAASGG